MRRASQEVKIKEAEGKTKAAEEEAEENKIHGRMIAENQDMRAGYTAIDKLIVELAREKAPCAAFLQTAMTGGANAKPLPEGRQPSNFCMLVLQGRIGLVAGREGFHSEAGAFSTLAPSLSVSFESSAFAVSSSCSRSRRNPEDA